jgi:Nickel responsive protein SCO4226-like
MPRYLIRRVLGDVTDDELEAAADVSRRVRVSRFPDIEWEHSHVVRTSVGLTSYCVYAAPTEDRVRDHAAAAGLPADEVHEITQDLLP